MSRRAISIAALASLGAASAMCNSFSGTPVASDADGGAPNGDAAAADAASDGPNAQVEGGVVPGSTCDVNKPFGVPIAVDPNNDETSFRFTADQALAVVGQVDNSSTNPLYAFGMDHFPDGGFSLRSNALFMAIHDAIGGEGHPAPSPDGLTLYFDRDPNGANARDIYTATRTNRSASFVNVTKLAVVSSGSDDRTPYVSSDGQILYFVSTRANGTDYDIYRSVLGGSGFQAPSIVSELSVSGVDDDAMIVSPDGLVAYFASNRDTDAGLDPNIWVASRTGPNDTWQNLHRVSELDTDDAQERPDVISADLCTIYFHRVDAKETHIVYVATKTR